VAIAAGILLSRLVSFETRELAALIAAFGILTLFCLWRQLRVLAGVCCLLALVAAGVLVETTHRLPPRPELNTDASEISILTGCVVEPSAISPDRDQFTLELEPGARVRVSLYVREGEQPPVLRYGQRIELDAKVRPTHNFNNPGSFDYAHYLARKGIYWTGSARAAEPIHILPGQCGSAFRSAIFRLRTAAVDRLARLYSGSQYETGMMQAILIGETANLDKAWTEQFRSTGTFHALVISGAHVAVLAAFLYLLLRLFFLPRMTANLITVVAIWIYALVTGFQAPAVRSASGFTLFMIGSFFFRRARAMNLLAAIAIAFLVLDPEQMFDASFQLSFGAVAFIAAFAIPLLGRTLGPLTYGMRGLAEKDRDLHMGPRAAQFRVELRLLAETLHLWTRVPEKYCLMAVAVPARVLLFFYELTVTSAMIQIGLALPMAIYFHRVSFSGLSANAVIVPLLALAVPVGFVAVFTGWTLPANIAGWLLSASQSAAAWHAHWEPNWRIPGPPVWLAISITAALVGVSLLARRSEGLRWRILRWASVATLALLLAVMIWHPFPRVVVPRALEMTAIDVGQGDSIFLALPAGKLMLVDGGGIASFGKRAKTAMNIGEDVVSPYLWSRSIRNLDVVALSHAHEDHIGGLPSVLENFHVQELWTGATPEESPEWANLRRKAEQLGVRIVHQTQGREFEYGGVRFEVLAPVADYQPAGMARNNDSLVMRLTYRERSLMLSGDVERQIESELVAGNLVHHADILKVAHHGSKTSTTEPFLEAVHPAFAVISAGFANLYGHPNVEVVDRLHAANIEVLRTDQMGAITVRTDGHRFEVETQAPGF
jgi:competence protein ComEC